MEEDNGMGREASVENLVELAACYTPISLGGRRRTLSIGDFCSPGGKAPQTPAQVCDALTNIVQHFQGVSEDDVKLEIARALSSDFSDLSQASEGMLELLED